MQKIIILDSNFVKGINSEESILIKNAFIAKGFEVIALNPLDFNLVLTPYGVELFNRNQNISDAKLLFIRRTRNHNGLIYDIAKSFEEKGILAIDSSGAVVFPKGKLHSQIDRIGSVNFPKSVFISNPQTNPVEILKSVDFSFPFIVKPQDGKNGVNIFLVNNIDELLDSINKIDSGYIIQEAVDIEKEYRVLVVGGRSIGIAQRASNSAIERTSSRRKWYPAEDAEAEALAEQCAKLGKSSIYGVDIARDSRGKLFVIECNRSPQFKAFRAATGVAVEDRIVEFCLEKLELMNT